MEIFTIIAIVVFIALLLHSNKCTGDIDYLSDIAYDKHKWIFPTLMVIMSFCLFLGMIDKTESDFQWLCFIAMLGCMGVGVTPYKDSDFNSLHHFFAITTMVCMCFLWFLNSYWYLPFLFCLAGLRKKWLLGVELGIIASAFAYALI